jgi:hypothetical protein
MSAKLATKIERLEATRADLLEEQREVVITELAKSLRDADLLRLIEILEAGIAGKFTARMEAEWQAMGDRYPALGYFGDCCPFKPR